MEVLVDTSVWSLALRRNKSQLTNQKVLSNLSELIKESRVRIIGPIRQEILSGISEDKQHEKLRKHLAAFEDLPVISENYERAAEMFNLCRKKGISGSHTDFLICSVAEDYHLSILTTDKDFISYSKVLPINLFCEP